MTRRGFTLIEIIVVIGLIGLMAVIGFRALGPSLSKQQVISARNEIAAMHSKAKANAIHRAMTTTLHLTSGYLMITSTEPVTSTPDTIGSIYDIVDKYGVRFTTSPTRDSLVFDSRGIGTETASTLIIVSKDGHADTVSVSSVGRILN